MAERLDERGDPQAAHDAERTKFSARETRQAGMGARIFLVLVTSLVLALLAWTAVEWSQYSQEGQTGTVEHSQPAPASLPDAERRPSTESPEGQVPTDRNPTPQSGSGAPRENTAPDDVNR